MQTSQVRRVGSTAFTYYEIGIIVKVGDQNSESN